MGLSRTFFVENVHFEYVTATTADLILVVEVCAHEMFTWVFACSRLSRARVQTFNCTNGMDVSVKMKGNHSLAIYCCWPRTTTQTHDHDNDSICQWLRRARKALSNDHFITIGGACENEQTMNSYITHSTRKISRVFWRLLHPDRRNGRNGLGQLGIRLKCLNLVTALHNQLVICSNCCVTKHRSRTHSNASNYSLMSETDCFAIIFHVNPERIGRTWNGTVMDAVRGRTPKLRNKEMNVIYARRVLHRNPHDGTSNRKRKK